MDRSTLDSLTERARRIKARRPQDDHDGAMVCALIEDMCLALRQLNAELEHARPSGTKAALLRYTDRKRR